MATSTLDIIRGTTPTFTLRINDPSVDFTEAENVYASFSQGKVSITKTGEDLDIYAQKIDVYLSQEETLKFSTGEIRIQLNWTYNNAARAATRIASVVVGENLIGKVLQ